MERQTAIVARRIFKLSAVILSVCILAGVGLNQTRSRSRRISNDSPEGEFHLARLIYGGGLGGFRGFFNNWWAIDYPEAEEHFMPALRRITNMTVADDSIHL